MELITVATDQLSPGSYVLRLTNASVRTTVHLVK
jgi:hypothetical protein